MQLDTLIEAQLLLVVYRHIKVTTLDVLLRFLLLNVLLRTEREKKVFFSHFQLDQVSKSIHCMYALSFLLAAISGASRLTSPRLGTRRERRRCGVTATRRRPASRTSTAWHGFGCVGASGPGQRDPFLTGSLGDVLGLAEAKPRLSICVPSSPAWLSPWVFLWEVAKIRG